MAIYSSYRAPYVRGTEAAAVVENVTPVLSGDQREEPSVKPIKRVRTKQAVAPDAVVGYAVAAALMVLLLLTQSRLSAMSFAVDELETKIAVLERAQDKLLIAHTQAYSLERVEDYAVNVLGMIRPTADQYIYIEADTNSRITTETAP